MKRIGIINSLSLVQGGTTMFSLRRWVGAARILPARCRPRAHRAPNARSEMVQRMAWMTCRQGPEFRCNLYRDNIGNVSGGTSRGFIHLGRFDFSVDAISKSWSAGAGAGSLPICTRSTVADWTRNYIHNLATISEIEALPEARLYTAYFEQSFYNNALNIRVGQKQPM